MAKAPAKKARTRRAAPTKKATARTRATAPVVKRASVRDTYRQRNNQCTYDIADELCLHLKRGVPVDRACDLIGLRRNRYTQWCKWGEDYLDASDDEVKGMSKADREDGERYAYLYVVTKHTIAMHLSEIVSDGVSDKHGDYKRSLAILERRDPHNWARIRSRHIGVGEDLSDQFTPDPSFL